MYFAALIAVMLVTGVIMIFMVNGSMMPVRQMVAYYLDPISILLLGLICLALLLASGMLKDFNNAFRYVLKKESKATLSQLKRALEAVCFIMKGISYIAAFIVAFCIIFLLYSMADPSTLGPIVSMDLLIILYGMIINLVLLVIKSRLKLKIMEYISDNEDSESGGITNEPSFSAKLQEQVSPAHRQDQINKNQQESFVKKQAGLFIDSEGNQLYFTAKKN